MMVEGSGTSRKYGSVTYIFRIKEDADAYYGSLQRHSPLASRAEESRGTVLNYTTALKKQLQTAVMD